jgi:L-ascorbate metabolism protein UlaG (beta-lactamase superfamily)
MALVELPRLDAVLISHDHYDHLDTATIDALAALQDVPFVVPLGIGEHLRFWGVPAERVVELDWGQSHVLGDLTLTCTEARHFSGRGLTRNNRTLWSSWVAAAGDRRVFFGGDTGYAPAFAEIGTTYGPFDLTVIPIGAYDRRWPDVHVDPAEAVQVHRDVRGGVMLPIHGATFDLAFHDWSAPAAWTLAEARAHDVRVAIPKVGQRFDPAAPLPVDDWWSAVG